MTEYLVWGFSGNTMDNSKINMVITDELEETKKLFDALGFWEIGHETLEQLREDLDHYYFRFKGETQLHRYYPELAEKVM
tara:strand:- start:1955 stop:2194 length:240 start_codon:yes stop_codon:yes gene_type:complete